MATLADFRTRFPEFDTIGDPIVELNLDDATLEVSANFGIYQDVATLFLAAHFLTISQDATNGATGSIGGVASESVDGVSASYNTTATDSQSEQLLSSTVYGQRYLSYCDKIALGNVWIV